MEHAVVANQAEHRSYSEQRARSPADMCRRHSWPACAHMSSPISSVPSHARQLAVVPKPNRAGRNDCGAFAAHQKARIRMVEVTGALSSSDEPAPHGPRAAHITTCCTQEAQRTGEPGRQTLILCLCGASTRSDALPAHSSALSSSRQGLVLLDEQWFAVALRFLAVVTQTAFLSCSDIVRIAQISTAARRTGNTYYTHGPSPAALGLSNYTRAS